MKEQQRTNTIRQLSINNGLTFSHYNIASEQSFGTAPASSIYSNAFHSQYEDSIGQLVDFLDEEMEADTQSQESRRRRVQQHLDEHLSEVSQQGDSSVICDIMSSASIPTEISAKASPEASPLSSIPTIISAKASPSASPLSSIPTIISPSASPQPMPFGLNMVSEPKAKATAKVKAKAKASSSSSSSSLTLLPISRARSESRPGTRRESDEPEGIPRAKNRSLAEPPKEKRKRGRPKKKI